MSTSASDLEVQELAKINQRMADAVQDPVLMAPLNRTFHRTLFNTAKNRSLLQAVSVVQKTMLVIRPSTLTEIARASAVIDEDVLVQEALKTRNPVAAERAMISPIESSHRARLQQLALRLGSCARSERMF